MNTSPVRRVLPAERHRKSFDAAVAAASLLLLASEGRITLDFDARRDALDSLFAFLEEMNDALPKV